MNSPFALLIEQLGLELNAPLHAVHDRFCTIEVEKALILHLQVDHTLENVLLASLLGEIPPGKFREELLFEALKANHGLDPKAGVLSFVALKNELSLSLTFPLLELNGKTLAALIHPFIELAMRWKKSLKQGRIAPEVAPLK